MTLLGSLSQWGLADRICEEFSADIDDFRWLAELAEMEALTRKQDPPEGGENG